MSMPIHCSPANDKSRKKSKRVNELATMIGKSTKKQFAAKVSAFWSTPQNLLEINYLDRLTTMIGKRAKKPFPAKFGAFCNTPHRLLEIILNPCVQSDALFLTQSAQPFSKYIDIPCSHDQPTGRFEILS